MKRRIQHSHQHEQVQSEQTNLEASSETVREFATPEEMLRHDSVRTPVPPRLATRLQESISQAPSPKQISWWRRILGMGP